MLCRAPLNRGDFVCAPWRGVEISVRERRRAQLRTQCCKIRLCRVCFVNHILPTGMIGWGNPRNSGMNLNPERKEGGLPNA